ncbi:hypothetical protein A6X21_17590 [Planctopirus hydrillae]|uniref:Uncharacterized protein n=1 Tax=Planctopirus hydrillae TaxID=1841610 RepID=A0A1C3ELR0_9PLAN|nr:hypothetical protein A6X21_17590 [Planctopirus hydrillae]
MREDPVIAVVPGFNNNQTQEISFTPGTDPQMREPLKNKIEREGSKLLRVQSKSSNFSLRLRFSSIQSLVRNIHDGD